MYFLLQMYKLLYIIFKNLLRYFSQFLLLFQYSYLVIRYCEGKKFIYRLFNFLCVEMQHFQSHFLQRKLLFTWMATHHSVSLLLLLLPDLPAYDLLTQPFQLLKGMIVAPSCWRTRLLVESRLLVEWHQIWATHE